MNRLARSIRTDYESSKRAEAIVSRHGISAWLIILCAAIMSFLMLYTLSLGNVASSVADAWRDALTDSATIRVQVAGDAMNEEAAAVEEVLRTTPGIEDHREISTKEQLQLLEPWLGEDIPIEVLSLPRVFAVKTTAEGFDEAAILSRLKAEAPHAVWDDHLRWRGPLLASAERIKNISWFSTVLLAIAFVLLIFLAADASISANATSITLLRQIGATDRWIQTGFERRFLFRSFVGSVLGVSLGVLAYIAIIRSQIATSDFAYRSDLQNLPVKAAVLVVLTCMILGYLATRISTARYLHKNT